MPWVPCFEGVPTCTPDKNSSLLRFLQKLEMSLKGLSACGLPKSQKTSWSHFWVLQKLEMPIGDLQKASLQASRKHYWHLGGVVKKNCPWVPGALAVRLYIMKMAQSLGCPEGCPASFLAGLPPCKPDVHNCLQPLGCQL